MFLPVEIQSILEHTEYGGTHNPNEGISVTKMRMYNKTGWNI